MELVNNGKSLYTAFLCIGYGVLCGLIFTVVSHAFPLKKQQKIRRALRDISLSFWSALGLFLLSLSLTDGRPRLTLFVGAAVGYCSWKKLFERPFLHLSHWFLRPLFRWKNTIRSHFYPQGVFIQKKFKKTKFFSKKLLKFYRGTVYNSNNI